MPDAQLAFLIFGDVAEFALHGLARPADGFGIAQKRPACVGELKRRAAHKKRAAKLLFKSRNVGRERLLRDVQRFSGAGEVFLPRQARENSQERKFMGTLLLQLFLVEYINFNSFTSAKAAIILWAVGADGRKKIPFFRRAC